MSKFKSIHLFFAVCVLGLCLAKTASAQSSSKHRIDSVLVLGGANHTQAGFENPDVERAFIATAAKAAENLADLLTDAQIKNTKLIAWSRYPEYKEEIGVNTAICDCNFWMQVSVGKNTTKTPQTFFYEYELLSVMATGNKVMQGKNEMRAVRTVQKFKRKFEVPITSLEVLEKQTYEPFAQAVISELLKSKLLAKERP